jgi:hypothetical protein
MPPRFPSARSFRAHEVRLIPRDAAALEAEGSVQNISRSVWNGVRRSRRTPARMRALPCASLLTTSGCAGGGLNRVKHFQPTKA